MRFDFPVISIGNLTAGGTGKSPHIEYLIFLLQYIYKVATLSRGYGRKSYGFTIATDASTADEIGDEPRQFKQKFPETLVVVEEDRVFAIPRMLDQHPEIDVILLDDAFQHRSMRAGLSILLTEYSNLFTRDNLLPLGWLREAKCNYHRADIIIVTKCPPLLNSTEQEIIIAEIKPYNYQKVYFSSIQYGTPYSFYNPQAKYDFRSDTLALLVCGIAKFDGLKSYLETKLKQVYVRDFRDHHRYDGFDMESIRQTYENFGEVKKVMITTEKDAMRLAPFRDWFLQNKIEIFVQPISVVFLGDQGRKFDHDILRFVEITKSKMSRNSSQ